MKFTQPVSKPKTAPRPTVMKPPQGALKGNPGGKMMMAGQKKNLALWKANNTNNPQRKEMFQQRADQFGKRQSNFGRRYIKKIGGPPMHLS